MLNIGIPTAVEQFFFSLGVTLYGMIVISLGTQVYATQRVSMNVVQLSLMPGFGFGMAATTLVAQALGAGQRAPGRGGRAVRHALLRGPDEPRGRRLRHFR